MAAARERDATADAGGSSGGPREQGVKRRHVRAGKDVEEHTTVGRGCACWFGVRYSECDWCVAESLAKAL